MRTMLLVAWLACAAVRRQEVTVGDDASLEVPENVRSVRNAHAGASLAELAAGPGDTFLRTAPKGWNRFGPRASAPRSWGPAVAYDREVSDVFFKAGNPSLEDWRKMWDDDTGSDVYLVVYGLFPGGEPETWNLLNMTGFGLYHLGVAVYGLEVCYGGGPYDITGVNTVKLGAANGPHSLKTIMKLGRTDLTRAEVAQKVNGLAPNWLMCDYDLTGKNCQTFAKAFVGALGADLLQKWPGWVDRVARLGDTLGFPRPGFLAGSVASVGLSSAHVASVPATVVGSAVSMAADKALKGVANFGPSVSADFDQQQPVGDLADRFDPDGAQRRKDVQTARREQEAAEKQANIAKAKAYAAQRRQANTAGQS